MMRILTTLFCFILICSESLAASRFSFLTGYGAGASQEDNTSSEGPLMVMIKLEVDYLPNWVYGLEHSRAIGTEDSSSNISETSFGIRYHFLNPVSFKGFNQSKYDDQNFSVSRRGLSPYAGLGLGFASSSFTDDLNSGNNASSIILKIKGGMHWQLSPKYGIDFDGSYSLPMASLSGKGKIFFATYGFGFYYNF